jgi:hypothetical protein
MQLIPPISNKMQLILYHHTTALLLKRQVKHTTPDLQIHGIRVAPKNLYRFLYKNPSLVAVSGVLLLDQRVSGDPGTDRGLSGQHA